MLEGEGLTSRSRGPEARERPPSEAEKKKAQNGAGIRIKREGIAKGEEAQERMQDRRGGGEARLITGQCPFLQPGNDSGPANATCAAPTPQSDGKETGRRGFEAHLS